MNAPIPELRVSNTPEIDGALQVSLLHEPLRSNESDIPLIELLSAIGQYHRRRDLSHQERFGTHDQQSKRAIDQLKALEQLLHSANSENEDFVVEASLKIELVPNN